MAPKTYAVVGGAGFIGSHLVEALLSNRADTERVLVLDNFSSGSLDRLSSVANDSRLVVEEVDVGPSKALPDLMTGVDHVFHLAANPDIAAAVETPTIDFWDGTYLMNSVLEACRIAKVPNVTFTSGSGVYGEATPGVALREDRGDMAPISTYGASKLACESLLSAYAHMYDMRAVAFRFANVVGPRQTHGVTYDFVRKLLRNNQELEVLGDGSQTKSYVHIDDVISAMLLLDRGERPVFDVYNVGTLDAISVREIAELVIEEMKMDNVELRFTGGTRGWPGDVPKITLDSSKMRSLGWSCEFDSRHAVVDSIRANITEANVT